MSCGPVAHPTFAKGADYGDSWGLSDVYRPIHQWGPGRKPRNPLKTEMESLGPMSVFVQKIKDGREVKDLRK